MTSWLLLSFAVQGPVHAAGPPRRPVPDAVLDELDALEARFERALELDCDEARCFSTGCVYEDHAVADRPRSGSLPGLGDNQGPGAVAAQPWLTRAQCGFAHEPALDADDVRVLVRRLQARVSTGWVSVGVSPRAMDPLPAYFLTEPGIDAEPEAPLEEPPAPPTPTASEEVWAALLPHLFWMLGLALLTVCITTLVWAWRRVGRASIEEQMLLAELQAGAPEEAGSVAAEADVDPSHAFVVQQQALWTERLDALDPTSPDPALQALVRDRLRAGDIPFLAKALLRFPERFAPMFPKGGDVATAKLALADFLRTADPTALPPDADFFEALNRHAVAARVASQEDAEGVRKLRDDFGPTGIASTLAHLSPRLGGLLFSWTLPATQQEVAGLISPRQVAAMSDQLLLSNRISPRETEALLYIVGGGAAEGLRPGPITDQGPELDVAGALSVLLGRLSRQSWASLLHDALQRSAGAAPEWLKDVFVADMLEALPAERRADLLLSVDVEGLAAWLSVQNAAAVSTVQESMPRALATTVAQLPVPSDPHTRAAAARSTSRALARALHAQLAQLGMPFSAVIPAASVEVG